MPTKIIQLKTLHDNYTYLLVDDSSRQVAVVDPGDAKPVLKALKADNLNLTHILLTHHHYDHSGGVGELKKHCPKAEVVIHKEELPTPSQTVKGIQLGNNLLAVLDAWSMSE